MAQLGLQPATCQEHSREGKNDITIRGCRDETFQNALAPVRSLSAGVGGMGDRTEVFIRTYHDHDVLIEKISDQRQINIDLCDSANESHASTGDPYRRVSAGLCSWLRVAGRPVAALRDRSDLVFLCSAVLGVNVRICRGQGVDTHRYGAGSKIHDVSAEALCAGFHKPSPRERALLPRSARSVEIIEPPTGSPPGMRYGSEAAGGVQEGAREPAQLQAG